MANEIQTARGKIKVKLDIESAVTTFDTIINDCIEQAIPRLAPFVRYQIAEDTTVTLATDDDSFTVPVSTSTVERIYVRTSSNESWRELDLWRQVRNKVYINEPIRTTTYVKVIATRPFTYTDADLALLMVDSPASLLPLYLFAMAEFATYIVGNKRKFNIYQQMNGVRTLQDMRELAEFYENRAIRILEDEISAEG